MKHGVERPEDPPRDDIELLGPEMRDYLETVFADIINKLLDQDKDLGTIDNKPVLNGFKALGVLKYLSMMTTDLMADHDILNAIQVCVDMNQFFAHGFVHYQQVAKERDGVNNEQNPDADSMYGPVSPLGNGPDESEQVDQQHEEPPSN